LEQLSITVICHGTSAVLTKTIFKRNIILQYKMHSSAIKSQQHQKKTLLHSWDVWKTRGNSSVYCLYV